ncbi:oxidoreductase [Streptomyces regalis]|uniref:Oxidoreductase n=2 Tax=Streptomyces regalis TaxID=68262 RepID=A0A124G844_9ACTN|nr:oxidoreductase [Streptomyces regalis]
MRGIRVDPETRTAWVEGGCTWADVNHATYAFGLATTGGMVSTTGVGGLTTGGGMGYLARRCGLSCDNLTSVDLVTADGSFVTCTDEQNSDLMWAVRGGGGNFGVVTSFAFRLHPVADILGGPTFFPLDGDVIRRYRELVAEADEGLGATFVVGLGPPVPFLPERRHGRPVLGRHLERMPCPVINTLFDDLVPAGLYHYWKGAFTQGLPDGVVDAFVEYGAATPSIRSMTVVFPIDGACHHLGPEETAFAYRDADYSIALSPTLTTRQECEAQKDWVRAFHRALEAYSMPGAYVNFMDGDDQHRVQADYRGNHARPTALKRRYDPGNLFRLNHNIAP